MAEVEFSVLEKLVLGLIRPEDCKPADLRTFLSFIFKKDKNIEEMSEKDLQKYTNKVISEHDPDGLLMKSRLAELTRRTNEMRPNKDKINPVYIQTLSKELSKITRDITSSLHHFEQLSTYLEDRMNANKIPKQKQKTLLRTINEIKNASSEMLNMLNA